MVKFLQSLSQKHKRPFSWKCFATSRAKGVVKGSDGKGKALGCAKIMSKGDENQMIFQKQQSSY